MIGINKEVTVEDHSALCEELAGSQRCMKQLLKVLGAATWEVAIDSSGSVILTEDLPVAYSDEYRRMLGYFNDRDFPNTSKSWAQGLHPEDRDRVMGALNAHLSDKTGKVDYSVEYRMQKKTGGYVWVRDHYEVMRGANGMPVRVIGVTEDLTRKLRKDQLAAFIADFSETMRTMEEDVAKILESSGTLKKDSDFNLSLVEKSDESVKDIRAATDQIRRIDQQIKLIALNASVEAARAGGAAGRAFAVIAEEMHRLARGSEQVTEEIGELLEGVSEYSKTMKHEMHYTASLIDADEAVVLGMKETTEKIKKGYEELTAIIGGVANDKPKMAGVQPVPASSVKDNLRNGGLGQGAGSATVVKVGATPSFAGRT